MSSANSESVRRALGGALNRPRDWQDFERMTRDLFAVLHGTLHVDLHGRTGQPQGGVDVYFTDSDGQRVGIQCKLHDGAQKTTVAQAEFLAEIEKAKTFQPPISRFIFLTTGPNDVALKRTAHEVDVAHRANGDFEVHLHAWDWIEARLERCPEIAVAYGLTAYSPSIAPSPAMEKIGRRFDAAIGLINAGRRPDDALEHAEIAHFLGRTDWRDLERISAGVSSADLRELESLAEGLGLNPDWLIRGKDEPFRLDDGSQDARAQYDTLAALRPMRIVFARSRDWPQDTIVAAQRDDLRWWVFTRSHPTREDVGATGRHQIFDFCCLMRRLFRHFWLTGTQLQGTTISGDDYQSLIEGRAHPGAILRSPSNQSWWQDLAEMALDVSDDDEARAPGLRAVIGLARFTLGQIQQSSEDSGRLDRLREAGLPVRNADKQARLDMDVAAPAPIKPPKARGWPRVMALELEKAHFWFTAAHDGGLIDGACELRIINRAKIPLLDCHVRLVSVESDDGEAAVGVDFRVGSPRSGDTRTFVLPPGGPTTMLIARRDLRDIIGRPPWHLVLSTGDYDLPDGARYRLRLELWSNYEFPTLVELVLDIDHGKAVAVAIENQRV
ncbi:hypothetical protein BH10PSE4_BH10PSE4_46710 [soil metagenome]